MIETFPFPKAYLTFRRVTLASTLTSSLPSKSSNNTHQLLKNLKSKNNPKYLPRKRSFLCPYLQNLLQAHSTIFKNIWLYASSTQFKSNRIRKIKLITKRLLLAFGNISNPQISLTRKYFIIFSENSISTKSPKLVSNSSALLKYTDSTIKKRWKKREPSLQTKLCDK